MCVRMFLSVAVSAQVCMDEFNYFDTCEAPARPAGRPVLGGASSSAGSNPDLAAHKNNNKRAACWIVKQSKAASHDHTKRRRLRTLRLPDDDTDRAHSLTCSAQKSCVQCFWASQKSDWKRAFPWLTTSGTNGTFRLGCLTCSQAGLNSNFARCEVTGSKLAKTTWVRHAASQKHVHATGKDPANDMVNGALAPPKSDFLEVISELRHGRGMGTSGIANVGKARKVRRLKYCCAEGFRALARDALSKATTVALHQDCRAGRLLVRYTACSLDLKATSGTLGQILLTRDYTLDATGIKAGCLAVVKSFSLPRHQPPDVGRDRKLVDTKLAHHIRDIVEVWDTDAAGGHYYNIAYIPMLEQIS
jgi:hypothetical protein